MKHKNKSYKFIRRTHFKNVDINNFEPSIKCHGDESKIIPFLMEIAKNKRLKPICSVSDKRKTTILISFETETDQDPIIMIPYDFLEIIKKCQSSMIILSIAIYIANLSLGHSNLLIIDQVHQECELFEPHGEFKQVNINPYIIGIMKVYLPDYRYIYPLDYCPSLGPQKLESAETRCKPNVQFLYQNIKEVRNASKLAKDHTKKQTWKETITKLNEIWDKLSQEERDLYCPVPEKLKCPEGGFCVVWSTLYGHLRILNPDYSRSEVIDHMLKINHKFIYMKKYISLIDLTISDTYITEITRVSWYTKLYNSVKSFKSNFFNMNNIILY